MTKSSTMTIGIDLGDVYSQLCVLDEEGEVIEESKLKTDEAALRARFAAIEPGLAVLEAGTHSPWVSRLLKELGHECLVANPASLHRKGRKKSDRIDAEKLARWARSDPEMLDGIEHAGAEVQADMALVHSRRSLVEARTKLINRARGLVKSYGGRLPRCDADYFAERVRASVPRELEPAVSPLLEVIASLTAQVKGLEQQITLLAETKYAWATAPMQQVKGVGALTALSFALTIRDPGRFRKSRKVGPYLGLTSRQDQSGETDREHSISKAGNVYLRKLLVQSAHYILERGPDSDLKRWGLRKAAGGKKAKRRAVVAVARKLAVLLHRLWASGEAYRVLQNDEDPAFGPSPAEEPPPRVKARPSSGKDASARLQTLTRGRRS